MDSFEPWEAALPDYLNGLGDARTVFTDDAHAIAYALATDCFEENQTENERDRAVQQACRTEFGVLSDIMTANDLCDYVAMDGNVDVPRVNQGLICG